MMAETALKKLTVEEFFDWCPADDRRWELIDGVPVAMAPTRRAHQILASRINFRLTGALADRPTCFVQSEAGLTLPGRQDTFYIADLAVSCRPHRFEDGPATPDPILIVEILSPSTQDLDRHRKVADYREIPSVLEILLVQQTAMYCEVHRRIESGRWLHDILRGPDARLALDSVGLDLPLADLYANIALEPDPPAGAFTRPPD
jgi:Uma2 family endonuclease